MLKKIAKFLANFILIFTTISMLANEKGQLLKEMRQIAKEVVQESAKESLSLSKDNNSLSDYIPFFGTMKTAAAISGIIIIGGVSYYLYRGWVSKRHFKAIAEKKEAMEKNIEAMETQLKEAAQQDKVWYEEVNVELEANKKIVEGVRKELSNLDTMVAEEIEKIKLLDRKNNKETTEALEKMVIRVKKSLEDRKKEIGRRIDGLCNDMEKTAVLLKKSTTNIVNKHIRFVSQEFAKRLSELSMFDENLVKSLVEANITPMKDLNREVIEILQAGEQKLQKLDTGIKRLEELVNIVSNAFHVEERSEEVLTPVRKSVNPLARFGGSAGFNSFAKKLTSSSSKV